MESLTCRGKRFPHLVRTLVVHSIRPSARFKPLRDGFPVFGVTSAGSRPGGRPSSLLYDKEEGKKTYPAAAPPSGVPSFRRCRAGSSQTRPSGSDMRSPFSARHHLQSARQRGPEMQVINGQSPYRLSERLGVRESPSEPPSSAPAGGAFRRGCLSPKGEFRAGRLLGAAQGSRPKADR